MKARKKRALISVLTVIILIFLTACALGAFYVRSLTADGLDIELFTLERERTATSVYVMENGEWVEWREQRILAEQSFEAVALSDVPQDLIDAFVAIEDKRFFTHRGVDWYRTAGAVANYFLHFGGKFGASTITQQLIKNVTGESEATVERKIREIFFALELESEMSKDEIMELYLNVINLSDKCIGVGAAARRYFSKSVSELTLIECAALAAITNSPSYYNPITHPENNASRRDAILSQMYEQGMIERAELDAALGAELSPNPDDSVVRSEVHSWYIDMVIDDVIADLMRERGLTKSEASGLVWGGGLDIYIQIDREIQAVMDEYYTNTANFLSGEGAQSSMIIIDPESGDILGVVGAIGEKRADRIQCYATDTLRPPGSTIKPLSVYAPALERGLITYASVYDDVPLAFRESASGSLTPWPKNANGIYRGLSSMSYAVSSSANTVPLRILDELGLSHSFYFLRDKLHMESLVERGKDADGALITDMDYAALALGQLNWGVTLRELTAAYSIFADNGIYHAPRSYSRVLDSRGNVLLEKESVSEQTISDANAEIMTKLLREVVESGTASALSVGKTVALAAKTGTSQDNKDRLCIGYTPSLICGVWYGYEYPREIPRAEKDHFLTAFDTVLTRIYERDLRSAYRDRKFESSARLVEAEYCVDSGCLATEACYADPRASRVKSGYFARGSEPTELCTTHVPVEYDAVCGGIATVFTPREHVAVVGLLNIEREFPIPLLISDAQYVYRQLPSGILPYFGSDGAFFSINSGGKAAYFGTSASKMQYNRISTAHFCASDLVFIRNILKNQDKYRP